MREKRIDPLDVIGSASGRTASGAGFSRRLGRSFKAGMQRFFGIHRLMVPAATFVLLLVVTLVGYVLFTNDQARATNALVVIVNHDDVEQTVPTAPTDVRSLLKKLDIRMGPGDVVEPSMDARINQDDFRINVYRAKPVEVVDNGRKTFAFSAASTPRSVAKQAGATLYPEDALETRPVTEFLKDGTLGTTVTIKRAMPVTMNLYGETVQLRTQAKTVGELLKERGVKLEKDDSVQPAADTKLTAQTQVFLLRQGTKIASETQDIAMPVEVIQDPTLAMGTSAVRQAGSAGQKIVTFQLQLQNGKEIGRSLIQEVVTKNPVKQIEVRGSSLSGIKGNMGLAGISPSDYTYVDYVITHESHWNPAAVNAGGCAGLGQACPGSKLAAACPNWQNDPVCQLKFFSGYANSRYGGWAGAYQAKQAKGWW